jgi:hypothetical protein
MHDICVSKIAINLTACCIQIQLWFITLRSFNSLSWIEILISPFFFWNYFIWFWNSINWRHSNTLCLIIIILTTLYLTRSNSWKFCLLKIIIACTILIPFSWTKILHWMSILIILTWLSHELSLMLVLSLIIWILFISDFTISRYTSIFRNINTRVHFLSLLWCNWSLLIYIALVRNRTNSVTLSWAFYSCLATC